MDSFTPTPAGALIPDPMTTDYVLTDKPSLTFWGEEPETTKWFSGVWRNQQTELQESDSTNRTKTIEI